MILESFFFFRSWGCPVPVVWQAILWMAKQKILSWNEWIKQRMQKGNGCSACFQKVSKKEMAVPPVSKMWVFFLGKAKECTAKPGQRGAIRSKGQHWAMGYGFFFFRSWGCPVPDCLTNHLRKQKIVSSKLPLCLMARKQILDLRIRSASQNWSEMQNRVTNQSKSNS